MGHYEIKDSVSEPLPRLDWCSPLPRRHAPNPQDGSPRATSSIVPRQRSRHPCSLTDATDTIGCADPASSAGRGAGMCKPQWQNKQTNKHNM